MVKSFDDNEFAKYICTLKFTDLGDVAAFVREYYNAYKLSLAVGHEEEIANALMQYSLVMTQFGAAFLIYTELSLAMNKEPSNGEAV